MASIRLRSSPLEPVASEEPLEGTHRARSVHRIFGDRERGQLCLDERRGLEGLLVSGARPGLEPMSPIGSPNYDLAWWDGDRLFVADTYNHRIRIVDPEIGAVATFAGHGEEGCDDGRTSDATFYEPGGVSATSKALYVADTNNHAIRVILFDGGPTGTLDIRLT